MYSCAKKRLRFLVAHKKKEGEIKFYFRPIKPRGISMLFYCLKDGDQQLTNDLCGIETNRICLFCLPFVWSIKKEEHDVLQIAVIQLGNSDKKDNVFLIKNEMWQ
jgi:hypothetical protein